MPTKFKNLGPTDAKLLRLEVLREMADILEEIERGGPVSVEQAKVISHGLSDERLARLPLIDIIPELLLASKDPMTPAEICDALVKAGRDFDADDPAKSVRWALKKLVEQGNDVFHAQWGKWHHKDRYSKRKIHALAQKNAGKGGRSTAEHADLTRKGMVKARAKGAPIGAPSRLTAEKVRTIQRIRNEGGSVLKAMKEVGLAVGTFYNNRVAIEAWREGDPWPPTDVSAKPIMRLVK